MKTKYKLAQAHLCPRAADELIGYLMILIEELQLKYCSQNFDECFEDIETETKKGQRVLFDIPEPF